MGFHCVLAGAGRTSKRRRVHENGDDGTLEGVGIDGAGWRRGARALRLQQQQQLLQLVHHTGGGQRVHQLREDQLRLAAELFRERLQ